MLLVATATAIYAFAASPQQRSYLQAFQRLLAHADRQAMLPGGSDVTPPGPYALVIQQARKNSAGPDAIPPLWRARAFTHYAGFLRQIPTWDRSGSPSSVLLPKILANLHRATRIDPSYAGAWTGLAWLHQSALYHGHHGRKFSRYLAQALRLSPDDSNAEGMRAMLIMERHGGHGTKSGLFTGRVGFNSKKWRRAFCYRAAMYLEYYKKPKKVSLFFPPPRIGSLLTTALKYYAPRQLAEVRNGTWKPDPSADPFPPPVKKAAPAKTKPAATQGEK